ncbi:hypothetical protein [Paraburkholderia sp. J67]|uniref:hypothetical protein n=1 Tax=Paraburkholderia sp. J67 TaxID=2805435 RepID=UPI002ABD8B68|nr:hypothetical protein [Paraburkholderia sp. J67]
MTKAIVKAIADTLGMRAIAWLVRIPVACAAQLALSIEILLQAARPRVIAR